ncbi:hypothetical protein Mgra_00005270 [Meloidogyne graminicola]|uniref:Secreted protein n=1 Tax=Meloidogyne graminicola TaxID=189291 RepID=A0A8S9ZPW6_9BILA|nr:hypothetical protein Mgra_00005270 [Meloidogyne graminicola]
MLIKILFIKLILIILINYSFTGILFKDCNQAPDEATKIVCKDMQNAELMAMDKAGVGPLEEVNEEITTTTPCPGDYYQ